MIYSKDIAVSRVLQEAKKYRALAYAEKEFELELKSKGIGRMKVWHEIRPETALDLHQGFRLYAHVQESA